MCCFPLQRNTGGGYLHSDIPTVRGKKKIPKSEIFNIHIFLIFTTVVLQRINIVFSCLQYPQRLAQWLTYS